MRRAQHPSLYQIHTRLWLREFSREVGLPTTLNDVSDVALDQIAEQGFDWVWLLGIWQTGPASRQVSLTAPGCLREYQELLPDFTDADVCGSPFAVQSYAVHRDFGGGPALAR